MQHHILELDICVEYLATWVKIVLIGLIIMKVHTCIYKTYHHQQVHYYLV